MPSRRLNQVLWFVVIASAAYFGFQARDHIDAFLARVGTLDVREDASQQTVYLKWTGKIDAPMEEKIAAAFEIYRDRTRTFVLSLSSPGGSLSHGAKVVRLLRGIGETHRIETMVETGRVCASMCVPVYLQGQRRTAAADARFMFHEVSFSDAESNVPIDVPQSATAKETDRLFVNYFKAAGVPDAWIKKIRSEMPGGEEVWKSGRELVEENASIVQEVF